MPCAAVRVPLCAGKGGGLDGAAEGDPHRVAVSSTFLRQPRQRVQTCGGQHRHDHENGGGSNLKSTEN